MDAERIAEALLGARQSGKQVRIDGSPRDLDAAYAVQAAVAARCGPVRAFKTGRLPGGDVAIMAPILDMRPSPARFRPDEFSLIGVELEVGFLIDGPLPRVDAPDFEERAAACVRAVPVIEVCDSRVVYPDSAPPLLKLADNQVNGGLVVGEPVAEWRGLDLSRVEARLTIGSETLLDGEAALPFGDAFANFCGLARRIGDHCGGLQPGQVVITGSLNGLPWIRRGQRVEGEIRGLGRVAVEFPD